MARTDYKSPEYNVGFGSIRTRWIIGQPDKTISVRICMIPYDRQTKEVSTDNWFDPEPVRAKSTWS